MAPKHIIVIGAGYAGLAAATLLSNQGFRVTVVEQNATPGGRGRGWSAKGYSFDMGPSWYLMPEAFERFFSLAQARREDYWQLRRLANCYQVFFGDGKRVTISENPDEVRQTFEALEPGAGRKLERYLKAAQYKYEIAMSEFIYRDFTSLLQFFNRRLLLEGIKLDVLTPLDRFVRKTFKDERVRQLLEYSMVFLGSSPMNAPALYSLLAYVDLGLGVWFPEHGMVSVAQGLEKLARERGATFRYGEAVKTIATNRDRACGVVTEKGEIPCDLVLATADYAHVERDLLPARFQTYSDRYWKMATVAPSMLVAFLGVRGKVDGLLHHNMYFASNWERHFDAIFKHPTWPADPSFYLSATTKSDPLLAPNGGESLYLLVPVAAGLEDTDEAREQLFENVAQKIEHLTGSQFRDHLDVKRLYSQRDFRKDYNALAGSALGLSHTLGQTAVFRPARQSRKLKGLYFAGQYTHPGIGVPMALIAAELATKAIVQQEK